MTCEVKAICNLLKTHLSKTQEHKSFGGLVQTCIPNSPHSVSTYKMGANKAPQKLGGKKNQ